MRVSSGGPLDSGITLMNTPQKTDKKWRLKLRGPVETRRLFWTKIKRQKYSCNQILAIRQRETHIPNQVDFVPSQRVHLRAIERIVQYSHTATASQVIKPLALITTKDFARSHAYITSSTFPSSKLVKISVLGHHVSVTIDFCPPANHAKRIRHPPFTTSVPSALMHQMSVEHN